MYEHDELRAWLGELLTPAETRRLGDFMARTDVKT
jgi:hypothetical protein